MKKKQLKVLMVNRPEKNWVGGDFIKLKKVTEALIDLGVHVEIFEMEQLGLNEWFGVEQFDIVHTWNFSMLWSKYAIWLGGKKKKKLVASMVYYNTEAYIPYNFQQIMMDHLDAAIYETESEIDRVKKNLVPKNSYIIPNGVDSWWFEEDDSKRPVRGDYVLCVGRIEPNKGQLEAAIACRELGIKFICIGGTADIEYSKKCTQEGAVIYPSMDQKRLKRWYKHCSVYVQPSLSETWGMALDEAGTQGVPVVLSTGFERKDIPDGIYCIHGSIKSITDSIRFALSQKRNERFQALLKERTWKKVAEEYLEIYKEITK